MSTTAAAGASGRRRRVVFSSTKFTPPAAPSALVPRLALLDRLDAGGSAQLTIVVGSPGAGKTCLLAEWVRRQPWGAACWLSADRSDGDAVRFWQALLAAVAHVEPGFGHEATDLLTLDGAVSADFPEALLLADGRLRRMITVVVDDFQLVASEVGDHLQHVAQRGLTNLRLVIGTRSEPEIGLHRLRLGRGLCEIREADLRLTAAETKQLVTAMGVTLEADGFELLHRRTEGWAAGVQLVAVAIRTSDEPASVLARLAGTTQVISQYLTAEMLDGQPDAVRQFLLDTCVVDVLTPELCAVLSPVEGVTLPSLESANLLVTRLDPEGRTYRYHQLFVEALRYRLESRDPLHALGQHRRAADWLESQGDIAAALRHRWRAGQRVAAMKLLGESVLSEYFGGHAALVSDLSVSLTDADLRAAPGAAVTYAAALLLEGVTGPAGALLDRIQAIAGDDLTAADQIHMSVGRCHVARQVGDTASSISHGERALAAAEEVGLSDDWADITVSLLIRLHAWDGNFDRANELAARPSLGLSNVAAVELPAVIADLRWHEGRLHEADEYARVAIGAVAARHDGANKSSLLLSPKVTAGLILLEQGKLAEAERELSLATVTHDPLRLHVMLAAQLGLSRVWRVQGNFDAALIALADARNRWALAPADSSTASRIDAMEARLQLELCDDTTAEHLAVTMAEGLSREVLLAMLESARGLHQRAYDRVSTLEADAHSPRDHIEVTLTALRIACAAERDDVDKHAVHALDLAEPAGFLLAIAEAGAASLRAVCGIARRRPRSEFIDRLLATPPLPAPAKRGHPEFRIDALTQREQAVLRYLVTSMSYREIADDLFVSVNTIKTHVKNTIRKLGASSRDEAIQRARALNYL